jgi:hypothetical protein
VANGDLATMSNTKALFELYWHELLCSSGYEVEVHPTLAGVATNPDFLARRNGEPQFYLEATLAIPPGDLAADRQFAELHDTLDRMNSPHYFVGIEYRGTPQGNLRGRVIRERLEQWLQTLDHDEISRGWRPPPTFTCRRFRKA